MDHLQLRLFGPPEVQWAGQLIKFRSRKELALLIYLVLEPGEHPRERLIDLLWPASDRTRGQASLRNSLLRLRQGLGRAESYLISAGNSVRFDHQRPLDLDLHLLQNAQPMDLAQLQAAVACPRGPFLAGFTLDDAPDFDHWVSQQRAAWQQRLDQLFAQLTHLQTESGQLEAALTTTRHWLTYDPLQESAYRRLMQLYALLGERTAALQAYEQCRRLLADELGVAPAAETVALAERVRSAEFGMRNVEAPIIPHSQLYTPHSTLVIPFVGRASEQSQLMAAYHALAQGQPQVVCVIGEAGIGKTRLVQHFLAWVSLQAAVILAGRAYETGGYLPYQPVVDALRPRLEQENAPDDLLADVWLAELSQLLPELRDRYPDLPAPTTGDLENARARLFEAVARCTQALAHKPVIFFLDDLHWADEATLALIPYLCRRWRAAPTPILLVITLRYENLTTTPHLREWLGQLERESSLTRLLLGPLTAEATQQLVMTLAGEQQEQGGVGYASTAPRVPHSTFADWLFAETAGQPFFMAEMIKLLVEQQQVPSQQVAGRWLVDFAALLAQRHSQQPPLLPPTVREIILTRFRRLSEASAALLSAAAVLGRSSAFAWLYQVAGMEETAGLTALDELLRSQLVLENSAQPQPYTFAHDKIRTVVYSEASAARRQVFHRRAFTVLQEARAAAAELSHHARYAGLTEPAFTYGIQAGDDAMRLFAVGEAILHYQQAQALWPDLAADDTSLLKAFVQLQLQLGRAYELNTDFDLARAVYAELLMVAQQRQLPIAECAALNRLATLLSAHGAPIADCEALLQQAYRLAEANNDRIGLAETVWNMAQWRHFHFAPDVLEYAQRALALAREVAVPTLIARSLNVLAHAYTHLAGWGEVIPLAEEARQLYVGLGDRAMEAEQLCLLTLQYNNLGRLAESIACGRQALAIAQQTDNQWGETYAAFALSVVLAETAAVEEALVLAQRSVALVTRLNVPPLHIVCLQVLGAAQLAVGQLTSAQETLALAQQINDANGAMRDNAEVLANQRCHAYVLQGDWENAYVFARQALAARDYRGSLNACIWRWCEIEALLRHGDIELARQDLVNTAPNLERSPRLRLAWLWASARLARWEGKVGEAQAMLQDALQLAQTLNLPRDCRQLGEHIAAL